MDGAFGGAEDEAGEDVFLLDAADAAADLVAAGGGGDFVFGFAVEGGDRDVFFVGHHGVGGTFLELSGFDFAFDYGAHVAVFAVDGHHEGGFDFSFEGVEVVEVFEEGGAGVPGGEGGGDAVFDAEGCLGGDGHELQVGFCVAYLAGEEGGEFFRAFFVAVVAPFDGYVVHLVDYYY